MPEPHRADPVAELVRSLRDQIDRKDERIARLEALLKDATIRIAQIEGRVLLAEPRAEPPAPLVPQDREAPSPPPLRIEPPSSFVAEPPAPTSERRGQRETVVQQGEPVREITPTLDAGELRRRHAEIAQSEEWLRMLRPGSQAKERGRP